MHYRNSSHFCWVSLGLIHHLGFGEEGKVNRNIVTFLSSEQLYFRSVIPVEDEEDPTPQEQKPVSDIAGMAAVFASHKNNNSRAPYQDQMLIKSKYEGRG